MKPINRKKSLDHNDFERTWELAIKHAREVLAQKQRVVDAMWQAGQQKQEERKG